MATEAEQLATRKALLLEEIATGGGKPSYTLGAKTVDWTAYRKWLYEELQLIREAELRLQGPYIVRTQAR